MKKVLSIQTLTLITLFLLPISCDDDEGSNNETIDNIESFSTIESPYLICANRNPGGVGFDFEYNGKKGGANNIDSVSVSDFEADIVIKTQKADNEGSPQAVNYITLNNGATAINYSAVDTECIGSTDFEALSYETVSSQDISFNADAENFSMDGLETGTSGLPLLSEANAQLKNLVIADSWKKPAKNDVENDEPIWIIKTQEDCLVKMIVTEFPASNAPTATGYVNIEWAILQ